MDDERERNKAALAWLKTMDETRLKTLSPEAEKEIRYLKDVLGPVLEEMKEKERRLETLRHEMEEEIAGRDGNEELNEFELERFNAMAEEYEAGHKALTKIMEGFRTAINVAQLEQAK